jgi:hypothetical protein
VVSRLLLVGLTSWTNTSDAGSPLPRLVKVSHTTFGMELGLAFQAQQSSERALVSRAELSARRWKEQRRAMIRSATYGV